LQSSFGTDTTLIVFGALLALAGLLSLATESDGEALVRGASDRREPGLADNE
jgi:hypothetical protein